MWSIDFFWGEFCDWYLELIKPRLMVEELRTRRGADRMRQPGEHIRASLRLLHPVMPFITEEIWHAIYDGKPPLKSIALAAFPQAESDADGPDRPKRRWRSCRT